MNHARQRKLVMATAMVASLAGYFLLLLEPALTNLDAAQATLNGRVRDRNQLRANSKEIARLEKRLQEIRRDLSTRDGQGVAGALLERLGKEMGGRNVTNFTTADDAKRPDFFTRVNISFDAEGELQQIAKMLHGMTFWNEYFRVHSLTLNQTRGRLQCQIPNASALLPEEPVADVDKRKIEIFAKMPEFSKYDELVKKNMFEPFKPPPEKPVVKPPKPDEPPAPPPPKPRPSAEVYLSGINAETDGSYTALVQDAGNSSKFEFLRPGQPYFIYKVKSVSKEEIVFVNGSDSVTLKFGEKQKLFKE
ncbi:MAG TPA: hypothetical protein VI643_00745 [Planctomycetota bacterium]|nr:hypothetical protein [Planctomycetota bacterium]